MTDNMSRFYAVEYHAPGYQGWSCPTPDREKAERAALIMEYELGWVAIVYWFEE